ncbi:NUDIX hydrolase [Paenibacillus ginsengarvi]|uniref:NUDIX domain-containing protein n=1 Tax=Paenibacillus ginsengarvi TaxID=400777 RepID=A0A3B0C5A9_9BACL|nr:NUDIX domain-containing protein [Paenibacillus ginsengarvi]
MRKSESLRREGLIPISQVQVRRYRASSLCIIRKDDSILLEQFAEENGVTTFRPVGGTIEYGEDSRSAVIREVKEEIDQEITGVRLLGIVENIFPHDGQIGHEFDFIYEASLLDASVYEQEIVYGVEGDRTFTAVWKRLGDFKNNASCRLVPDGLYEMLIGDGKAEHLSEVRHINSKDILPYWTEKR